MRDYEIVYIFRSSFTPEQIDAKLERYHALITGVDGGQITAVEQWGKRQLSYPIDKEPNGFYVVAQFTSDPSALSELERILKLEDDLLRYLIVLSEGELPIPPSLREERDAAARRVAAEEARREEAKATGESEAPAEREAEVPDEAAEVPDEVTEVPDETAKVPDEAAEVPDEAAEVPDEAAEVPDEAAEAPDVEPEDTAAESAEADSAVAEEPEAEAGADASEMEAEVREPAAEKED